MHVDLHLEDVTAMRARHHEAFTALSLEARSAMPADYSRFPLSFQVSLYAYRGDLDRLAAFVDEAREAKRGHPHLFPDWILDRTDPLAGREPYVPVHLVEDEPEDGPVEIDGLIVQRGTHLKIT